MGKTTLIRTLLGHVRQREGSVAIAGDDVPHSTHSKAKQRADPEGSSPAVVNEHVGDERRSDAATYADAGKDDAVRDAPLGRGNPGRDNAVRCRIHDGFANA